MKVYVISFKNEGKKVYYYEKGMYLENKRKAVKFYNLEEVQGYKTILNNIYNNMEFVIEESGE